MFVKILLQKMIVKKENVKNGLCFDAYTLLPKHTNKVTAIVNDVKAQDIWFIYSLPSDLVFLDIPAIQVHQAYPTIRRQC